jgi:hypothetical protein
MKIWKIDVNLCWIWYCWFHNFCQNQNISTRDTTWTNQLFVCLYRIDINEPSFFINMRSFYLFSVQFTYFMFTQLNVFFPTEKSKYSLSAQSAVAVDSVDTGRELENASLSLAVWRWIKEEHNFSWLASFSNALLLRREPERNVMSMTADSSPCFYTD